MMIKNIIDIDAFRMAVIRNQSYYCKNCKAKHGAKGFFTRNHNFIDCDDFMILWAESNGKEVLTIELQLVSLNPVQELVRPDEIIALCQDCIKNYKKVVYQSYFYFLKELKKNDKSKFVSCKEKDTIGLSYAIRATILKQTAVDIDVKDVERFINEYKKQ